MLVDLLGVDSECIEGFQFIYDIPLPSGFIFCCQPSYGLPDIYTLSSRLYPEDNFGLSSFTEDDINRFFYAAGQNTCTGGEIPGSQYKEGLEFLRDEVLVPTGEYSTFFIEGDAHTFIQTDARFYEIEAGGKMYYEWIADVIHTDARSVHHNQNDRRLRQKAHRRRHSEPIVQRTDRDQQYTGDGQMQRRWVGYRQYRPGDNEPQEHRNATNDRDLTNVPFSTAGHIHEPYAACQWPQCRDEQQRDEEGYKKGWNQRKYAHFTHLTRYRPDR